MISKINHLLLSLGLGLGVFWSGLAGLNIMVMGGSFTQTANLPADPPRPNCRAFPARETGTPLSGRRGPIPHLGPCDNYAVYYGPLDEATVAQLKAFDLVILHPGNAGYQTVTRTQVAALQAAGVIVLGYVSIGEEPPGPPYVGEGRGPVSHDPLTDPVSGCAGVPHRRCQANNVASYYLDEVINATGALGQDGLPDPVPDWGSFYVDSASPVWRDRVRHCGPADSACSFYGADYIIHTLGADGLFLDTVDTASPWGFYAYTLTDMADFICQLSQWYPDHYLVINRGVFYADPLYGADKVRPCLNGILFEAYYSGWDGGKQAGQISPWFPDNRDNWAPKLNAQAVMTAGYTVFALDYFTPTQSLSITHQISETVKQWGWLDYVATPNLDALRREVWHYNQDHNVTCLNNDWRIYLPLSQTVGSIR